MYEGNKSGLMYDQDEYLYEDLQRERNIVHGIELRAYTPYEIKKIRQKAHMTQCYFAFYMGVTKKAVQAWQQGINRPDGPSRRLLGIIEEHPQFAYSFGIISKE